MSAEAEAEARARIDAEHARREQLAQVRLGALENPAQIPTAIPLGRRDLLSGKAEIDGAELLNDAQAFLRRFCVFPDEHCLTAVALWVAHAHAIRQFHTTPRLALISPEPESGKTRCLEVMHLLVPDSELVLNPSSASVFRKLAKKQITVLLDECDAIFKVHGKEDPREDLRAMLNSGYRVGATIPRCVGPKHEVIDFPVFAACALAGIGDLPDTVMSRSIIIRMRRRAPHERIDDFRLRHAEPVGHALRERLAGWVALIAEEAGKAWPALPDGVTDRKAECWEPLIAIADQAGGQWPEMARSGCSALCRVAADRRVSLGIRLLADLRIIFVDATAMHTETLLVRLANGAEHGLDADAPWADLRGQPINQRTLAYYLKKYGVSPAKVRIDDRVLQGYRRVDLWDAWQRYLPARSVTPENPEQAEQAEQIPPGGAGASLVVPDVPDVPDAQGTQSALLKAGNGDAHCGHCKYFKADTGEKGLGTCLHFNCDTWPAPNPGCSGYVSRTAP